MRDRPLLLMPIAEIADRTNLPSGFSKTHRPSAPRQFERLSPQFDVLTHAMDQKSISLQNSTLGLNPEMALVFEVIGSVGDFYSAVKKISGLEWIFDDDAGEIQSSDDFYGIDKGKRLDKNLPGRVYCVMTNREALEQLLSIWRHYTNDPTGFKFKHGYTPLREVFLQLKSIRLWGPQDRIYETNVRQYWEDALELVGDQPINFEVELFYRQDSEKRFRAVQTVTNAVVSSNGRVLKECIIDEISYNSLMVSLPRNEIERLLGDNYHNIELAKVDDIMFFRPACQTAYPSSNDSSEFITQPLVEQVINEEPILAILDGMPLQNHALLTGRLIVDDPDYYEAEYTSDKRRHGTAMTSLMIFGDLNNIQHAHKRKVYARPIFKPFEDFNGHIEERIPNDVLVVDLIHRAVKRMFEGENGQLPTAPTVKVINLSLGDPDRLFYYSVSPLARLLDWLSNKYNVLFVISAGNHNCKEIELGIPFRDFKDMSLEHRTQVIYTKLTQIERDLRLLSPSECINGLTVGALFSDKSNAIENSRVILPMESGLTSLISSIGLGINRSIKPDIYYNGGRKMVTESSKDSNTIRWSDTLQEPGCRVAAPTPNGGPRGEAYIFGTSPAAAQISHEAGFCHDVLSEVFHDEIGESIPNDFAAILLKTMLVHGASWEPISYRMAELTGQSPNRLIRWLGNGIPNISRVEQGAKNRITMVGYGSLEGEQAHLYKLPLPFDFSSGRLKRRLTVTLSYSTPILPTRQIYRSSQVWFVLGDNSTSLFDAKQNTDIHAVLRGTMQHEIFTGDKAITWDSNNCLDIKVNCRKLVEVAINPIHYSIFVTFEVAEGIDLDVYTEISLRIKPGVTVPTI